MTIDEKFAVLQNEYMHLIGKYTMMKADYESYLRDEKLIMLDKIRAEIEALQKTYPFIDHFDTYVKEDDVKKIIDKYKS